jgi:hypothetical protein
MDNNLNPQRKLGVFYFQEVPLVPDVPDHPNLVSHGLSYREMCETNFTVGSGWITGKFYVVIVNTTLTK